MDLEKVGTEQNGVEKEGTRQRFLEDQCELHSQSNLRSSLHLDLDPVEDEPRRPAKTPFVTVINVNSPDGKGEEADKETAAGARFTFTQRSVSEDGTRKFGPKTASKPDFLRHPSQESLNSVSSPLSPSSPLENILLENLLSPREGPASPPGEGLFGGSDLSTDPSPTNTKYKPDPPERTVSGNRFKNS